MLRSLPEAIQALIMALLLGLLFSWAQRHLAEREKPPEGAHAHSLKPEGTALLIGGLAGLCFASEGAVLDWSSIYMRTELGAMTETAGAGYAAFSATMAIGRFLGDWIRSHLGADLIVRAGALLALVGLLSARFPAIPSSPSSASASPASAFPTSCRS